MAAAGQGTRRCPRCGKTFKTARHLKAHDAHAHGPAARRRLLGGAALLVVGIGAIAFGVLLATWLSGASQQIAARDVGDTAALVVGHGQPTLGNDSAPVALVLFEDPDCPFCKRFHDDTLSRIVADYVDPGSVRIIGREFSGGNPWGAPGMLARECAFAQRTASYWNFTSWFYRDQANLNLEYGRRGDAAIESAGVTYAGSAGLDAEAWRSCFTAKAKRSEVSRDLSDGQKAGARGTPSFFVVAPDGHVQFISGAQPYPVFAQAINAALGRG
ncbi:MAG: thioredoxin domain-containing protein [Euryarchaeota archaeon]|nr:thioredoxin domain-containing protein [Euryarchaeota archaeon]